MSGQNTFVRRVFALTIAALLALTGLACAEGSTSGHWLRINRVLQDDTGIMFYVNLCNAYNESLGSVANYDPSRFEAKAGNTYLPLVDDVAKLSDIDRGTHFYICIDVSKTMTHMKEVRSAVATFVSGLNPTRYSFNYVSIWTFGKEVKPIVQRGYDLSTINQAMEKVEASEDWTHIYECVYKVVNDSSRNDDNVVILLITDGADDQGDLDKSGGAKTSYDTVRTMVAEAGMPIYGMMVPGKTVNGITPNTTELTALCTSSGGYFRSLATGDELSSQMNVVRKIADDTTAVHVPIMNDGTLAKRSADFSVNVKTDNGWVNCKEAIPLH